MCYLDYLRRCRYDVWFGLMMASLGADPLIPKSLMRFPGAESCMLSYWTCHPFLLSGMDCKFSMSFISELSSLLGTDSLIPEVETVGSTINMCSVDWFWKCRYHSWLTGDTSWWSSIWITNCETYAIDIVIYCHNPIDMCSLDWFWQCRFDLGIFCMPATLKSLSYIPVTITKPIIHPSHLVDAPSILSAVSVMVPVPIPACTLSLTVSARPVQKAIVYKLPHALFEAQPLSKAAGVPQLVSLQTAAILCYLQDTWCDSLSPRSYLCLCKGVGPKLKLLQYILRSMPHKVTKVAHAPERPPLPLYLMKMLMRKICRALASTRSVQVDVDSAVCM